MYKLIILDLLDNVLDKSHYLTKPSQELQDKALYDAVKRFNTFVKVKVETVKYIEYSEVA